MIRKFKTKDFEEVMDLWLSTNIKAHSFIPRDYWTSNYQLVKEMLPNAELFVHERDGKVMAFMGVDNGYIAGIFVSNEVQSQGIGRQLLERAKAVYDELSLTVYQKNEKAVAFYQREQFVIRQEKTDENTNEIEYLMMWRKSSL